MTSTAGSIRRRRRPSLDTGNYYATFQDFAFALRYNILDRGLTVTPLVAATIPSHHYRTVGESAPGLDRLALHTGVSVGRLLDPLLPNGYIHGRYSYAFVQPFRGIPLDRQSAELEVGYAITPIGRGPRARQLDEDIRRRRVLGSL